MKYPGSPHSERHSLGTALPRCVLASLLLGLLLATGGCAAIRKLGIIFNNIGNDTNTVLENALDDLNANAGNYAHIMEEAIDKIKATDIKEALRDALNNAIITASTEVRCDIQFTADYLKHRIREILADLNNTTPPPAEPQVCNVSPSVIDMNLPANQRNAANITGYFLNQAFSKYRLDLVSTSGSRSNKTSKLSASTDFKLIINLGSNGIVLDENSDKLALKWDGRLISEIAVIQRTPEPCRLRERTLGSLPKMVVYPAHKKSPWTDSKGDKEFAGHGPCTKGNVSIFLRNNRTELWARAFVQMWECSDDLGSIRSDYTYGDRTKESMLTRAESGWRIKRIRETTSDRFQNIDRDTDATERISGGGPVSSYLIQGDTSGDDLGSSRVEISFKGINVTLEEVGDCVPN